MHGIGDMGRVQWVIFCATSKPAFFSEMWIIDRSRRALHNTSHTVGYFVDTYSETHGNGYIKLPSIKHPDSDKQSSFV